MDERISKLIDVSKGIIRDCALENGAIVAANSIKEYYSREAKHYFYVWPRDAAFTCMAAKMMGINDIQEPYFNWLETRAEDMDDSGRLHEKYTGILYEKYYVNGLQALHRFQPDQTGATLMAVGDFFDCDPERAAKYKNLMVGLADGLCKRWHDDHFALLTNDLWEERHTFPDLKDNFSFAMAACSKGLSMVNKIYPNPRYEQVSKEMKELLLKSGDKKGYYMRSFGILDDDNIDASMLGLLWPFEVVDPNSEHFQNTVRMIEEKITRDRGVFRYEKDEYDGWMYNGWYRKKGAGWWPLLNFWLAIALNKMGRHDDAIQYYYKVIDSIDLNTSLIPEQIFDNDIQKAVSPLCWSHTMFLFATKELGLME